MKKILAMLLALVMIVGLVACGAKEEAAAPAATEAAPAATEAAPAAPADDDVIEVDYYCNVGGYLATLQSEVDEWNNTTGKEKGVYLNLISNINSYDQDLEALMSSGTYYDIIHANHQTWVERGWVQDLREVGKDFPEFQALLDSYEPYINAAHEKGGVLLGLPCETLPIKLAVNLDLLEKNNLEIPTTWAEMVECCKVITENGNGEEFGMGWSTWGYTLRRLGWKSSMNSIETPWWDPNTQTYSFDQYKPIMDYLRELYTGGYMLGADDLDIDPIRQKFAEGVLGFFPAPSYDYAVYTEQFPAECNWTVIDMPVLDASQETYKGVYISFPGAGICKPAYDAADDAKKAAIVECLMFLNSDELNTTIYEMGGNIPGKTELIANATPNADMGPQWALFADMENYTAVFQFPDKALLLEGDTYDTMMTAYMRGEIDDWDAMVEDLEARYNQAYADLVESGATDVSLYEAPWSH